MRSQKKAASSKKPARKTVAAEEARQPPVQAAPTTQICVSDRIPAPGGSLPPLPDLIEPPEDVPVFPGPIIGIPFRALRGGCYLLRYTPLQRFPIFNPLHYDGTLRVERVGLNTIASGDLYRHLVTNTFTSNLLPFPPPRPAEPNPGNGIPIFPRSEYRYYVLVTKILEFVTTASSFDLGFQLHRFTSATNSWNNEGAFTAKMQWTTAPAEYPAPGDYLKGDVKNAANTVVGTLTMGWISSFFRRAVMEIDRVNVSEAPLDNGAGVNWKTIFDMVGWDLKVVESNADIAEPSGNSWSDAEMHATMLARRDASNLDAEWRYYVLAVRNIDSTPRGIMFDAFATDSNKVPREGAGIASHWTIPNANPWGLVKGKRFGTAKAPYFRTAVHEIGHAMGLYHNTVDMGVMNTTDVIAASATPANPFPNNIQWSHASDDQKRLRHFPDIWIRPGGTPFGLSYNTAPISPDDLIADAAGLELRVEPLLESVPIGAPVRINYSIVNTSTVPLPAPASLNLRTGFVKGKIVDPAGTVRTFRPLVRCIEEHEVKLLQPGEKVEYSATLLRGPEGALFPAAGAYRVILEVDWEVNEALFGLAGETPVMVTPAKNSQHAEAALKILSTPDTLLTLVLGGDHLTEGIEAIQAALDEPVLRPHYAYIEAKRVGKRFQKRKPDYKQAAELMKDATVLTPIEAEKAAQMMDEV